ncbi:nucleotide sugar dehydrogenase [Cytobacillus gottheilii]|uniref:nucleotide sugar dehydrogenase n=1 Tax=Cytobacillus gottheilii TaxID=859144 RepID=UPI0009BA63E4|nr:nucleotide sugar dehydrogenase [Cytobacillus gottheilii]
MEKICVIGLGYIGLPTSVMFANHGKKVHGVDVNASVVAQINKKEITIEENGLEERLITAVDSGNFTASTTPVEADVFIIAVPSPINEDKSANLKYVQDATRSILPYVKKGDLVILESTVPPRTVQDIMIPILKESDLEIGVDLFVSHSPERVIPGHVFEELVNNSRIVGGVNQESSQMTADLYRTFVKGEIFITNATTAEMVKVIENTYRDVNIAFANELAKISENIGVNVWEAISLANHHPRVNIHQPGPGVGGHCIAVDPWFLVELDKQNAEIINLARKTNDGMPEFTAKMVQDICAQESIHNPKVAVLGLSFKADIDDMRESPSLDVLNHLAELNIKTVAYDPHIHEMKLDNQTNNLSDAVTHSDLIVVLTAHSEFKELDPNELANMVRSKIILDTKNCLDRQKWESAGFRVRLLGDAAGKSI